MPGSSLARWLVRAGALWLACCADEARVPSATTPGRSATSTAQASTASPPAAQLPVAAPAAQPRVLAACPDGTGDAWHVPAAPTEGERAWFAVDRVAGEYDQPRLGTCVEQSGKHVVVRHGEPAAFAIPAASRSLTQIDGWAYVAIPAGGTLSLGSHPCTSRDLRAPWLDTYTPPPADPAAAAELIASQGGPSELVFLRGSCSAEAASAVRQPCAPADEWFDGDEVPTSCVTPGRGGHCTPVSIAQPDGSRAYFLLAYGDRFAVCLGDQGQVTSTLRLAARR